MDDHDELSFVIPGYIPETMPLDRLIEYLQQMAVVLGDPKNLHLVEIRKSSVSPVLRASKATALEARERARCVQRGDGTRRQNDAYNKIRRMVRRDAVGTLYAGRSAILKTADTVILEIPAAPDDLGIVDGLRQATTIDGELIRIGGSGDDAALQVQDLSGRTLSGFTANRSLAKELCQLLYEPVRLNGIGIWCRDSEGTWTLSRMQVQSYERLEEEEATLTLERMRSLAIKWPDNAIERLRYER
jgi:hypothetical protein